MWHFVLLSDSVARYCIVLSLLGSSGFLIPQLYQSLAKAKKEKNTVSALIETTRCQAPKRLQYKWPFGFDLIVQAFSADRAGKILSFFLYQFERTANTFEQIILGGRGIGTQDPENIEAILSTQFHEFGLGVRSDNFRPLLGNGIFTQEGEAWKVSRDLLRPQFLQTRTKSFGYMQTEIEKFMHSLGAAQVRHVDLQPLFFRLTLDTTMAVLFGKPANSSQAQSRADEAKFAQAFDYAQHRIASRARLGDLYWLLGGKRFRNACETVHKFVENIVADALEETESEVKEDSADRYVFLRELIKKTRDPLVLRDQLLNVLLAGRDTTGCLLSWTTNMLATHQDVQNELRKECFDLESYKAGELPTTAEIKGMKYLHNVIREVLRLYPSVPCNTRFALKTTTLPVGGGPDGRSPIIVRKGEGVGYSPYVMHRRKDTFGEDATSFRPSRWDDDNKDGPDLRGVGYAYLPFNGGPRVCPGQEFGLLEASYTIVRLLQSFRQIEKPEGRQNFDKHNVTLVLTNADGCKVILTPFIS